MRGRRRCHGCGFVPGVSPGVDDAKFIDPASCSLPFQDEIDINRLVAGSTAQQAPGDRELLGGDEAAVGSDVDVERPGLFEGQRALWVGVRVEQGPGDAHDCERVDQDWPARHGSW